MFKLDIKTRLSFKNQLDSNHIKDASYYFKHGFTIASHDYEFKKSVENLIKLNLLQYEKRFKTIVESNQLSIKNKTILINFIENNKIESIYIQSRGFSRLARTRPALLSKLNYLLKKGFSYIYFTNHDYVNSIKDLIKDTILLDNLHNIDCNKYNTVDSIYSNNNYKTRLLIYYYYKQGLNFKEISLIVKKDYHIIKDVINNKSIHFIDKVRISNKYIKNVNIIKKLLKNHNFTSMLLIDKLEYLKSKSIFIKKSMFYIYVNSIKQAEDVLNQALIDSNFIGYDFKINNNNNNIVSNFIKKHPINYKEPIKEVINAPPPLVETGFFKGFFKI